MDVVLAIAVLVRERKAPNLAQWETTFDFGGAGSSAHGGYYTRP